MQTDPMAALRTALSEAAAGRLRPELVSESQNLANQVWGPDAPEIDEGVVRDLQKRLRRPPGDGRAFRALLCALGIRLVDALRLLEYWPDLRHGTGRSATQEELIVEGCAAAGVQVRVQARQGSTVVLELL